MNPDYVLYVAGLLAISQIVFMGISYIAYHYHRPLGRLFALYSLCLVCYIILVMPPIENSSLLITLPLRGFAVATPAVLWLITRKLFQDNAGVPLVAWLVISLYILLRLIGGSNPQLEEQHYWFYRFLPHLTMLGFAAHACYLSLRDAGADLVESRVQMRPLFVFTLGMVSVVIVGMNVTIGAFYDIGTHTKAVYAIFIFIVILFFNVRIFRMHQDFIDFIYEASPTSYQEPPELSYSETKTLDRIMEKMEEESLYTKQGMTIGDLAQSVNMKEYLLRRFIHEKLQYRNFNQFINEYRLRKATEKLADSKCKISAIALELGYSSPSAFNNMFRKYYDMTPTEFRRSVTH